MVKQKSNNSKAVLTTGDVAGDATVDAIKKAQRIPIGLPPEVALVFARRRAPMLSPPNTDPPKKKRGRPKGDKKPSAPLIERLERMVELGLPKLPSPASAKRFRAGDITRKTVRKLDAALHAEGIVERKRTGQIVKKDRRLSERQVRRVRGKLKVKPMNKTSQ